MEQYIYIYIYAYIYICIYIYIYIYYINGYGVAVFFSRARGMCDYGCASSAFIQNGKYGACGLSELPWPSLRPRIQC